MLTARLVTLSSRECCKSHTQSPAARLSILLHPSGSHPKMLFVPLLQGGLGRGRIVERLASFNTRNFLLLFRVRCPRCGQTAEITEDQLGRQGQCNNCGALVAIPARLSKVCFVCGIDVANISHTKDEHSNYLCTNCFASRKPAEQSLFFPIKLECSICHVQFPREQAVSSITGPICRECATILQNEKAAEGVIPFAADAPPLYEQERVIPRASTPIVQVASPQFEPEMHTAPTAVAEPPPAFEDLERIEPIPRRAPVRQLYAESFPAPAPPSAAPSKSNQLPLILSCLALAGVAILAVLHFSSHPQKEIQIDPALPAQTPQHENHDQETLTRVLILKGQAEVLMEVGKLREGIDKYEAVLRIQTSNPAIAAEIDSSKLALEKALKLLAASSAQTPSAEKPLPDPDPQKKPQTIFDEK